MKNSIFLLLLVASMLSSCSTSKRMQTLAQKCAEEFPCVDTLEIYYDTVFVAVDVPPIEVIDTVQTPCPPNLPDTTVIYAVRTVKIPGRTITVEVPKVDTVRVGIDQALRQAYVDLKHQYEIKEAELTAYKKARPARASVWARIFPWIALVASVIVLVLVIKKKR